MLCYSGWTIFLVMVLAGILNGVTVNSKLLGALIFVGGILFYIFQNRVIDCKYPDPNA